MSTITINYYLEERMTSKPADDTYRYENEKEELFQLYIEIIFRRKNTRIQSRYYKFLYDDIAPDHYISRRNFDENIATAGLLPIVKAINRERAVIKNILESIPDNLDFSFANFKSVFNQSLIAITDVYFPKKYFSIFKGALNLITQDWNSNKKNAYINYNHLESGINWEASFEVILDFINSLLRMIPSEYTGKALRDLETVNFEFKMLESYSERHSIKFFGELNEASMELLESHLLQYKNDVKDEEHRKWINSFSGHFRLKYNSNWKKNIEMLAG